jgi:P-type conjugative transfer ATPase TrbB
MTTTTNDVTADRFRGLLRSALGPTVLAALEDPRTVEVMANADGRVWVDRAGEGRSPVGTIDRARAEAVVRLVADRTGESVGPRRPFIAGTLPGSGERFQGQLPPITAAPVFAIRKRAKVVYTLDDYVAQGVMTPGQCQLIREVVADRQNVLIAGGTGSGKTTLANALLAEPPFAADRVVLIEDTRELRCSSPDRVELLTKATRPTVTMDDLVRHALRLRPDRIVVGEVRGPEALALLKAWNTGHPGGLATVHADGPADALARLEDLAGEAARRVPRRAIARAVNVVVFVRRTPAGRRVEAVGRVMGLDGRAYQVAEG